MKMAQLTHMKVDQYIIHMIIVKQVANVPSKKGIDCAMNMVDNVTKL